MGRLKLEDVRCEVREGRIRARVQLSNAGLSHIGLATGTLPEATCERVIAQATINAVRQFALFTGRDQTVVLHDLDIIPSSPAATVLVSLRLGQGEETRLLSGSAPVRDEAQVAAARAVLDGLNRQVEALQN
ncbi:MAG TPA: hypothetical protein VNN19_02910 [bacterium]|nr:hypothetical protein [bacterium]